MENKKYKAHFKEYTYPDNFMTGNEDEILVGGLSDGYSIDDIADKYSTTIDVVMDNMEKGVEVELEHTDDIEVAKEIAKDHIWEDLFYYDKLATIENNDSEEVDDVYYLDDSEDIEDEDEDEERKVEVEIDLENTPEVKKIELGIYLEDYVSIYANKKVK